MTYRWSLRFAFTDGKEITLGPETDLLTNKVFASLSPEDRAFVYDSQQQNIKRAQAFEKAWAKDERLQKRLQEKVEMAKAGGKLPKKARRSGR
jgi:hypothetical protein